MMGHHSRLRESDNLLLWRGPAVKKKPPYFNARALGMTLSNHVCFCILLLFVFIDHVLQINWFHHDRCRCWWRRWIPACISVTYRWTGRRGMFSHSVLPYTASSPQKSYTSLVFPTSHTLMSTVYQRTLLQKKQTMWMIVHRKTRKYFLQ